MSSRKVILAHDGVYYFRGDVAHEGGRVVPRPGAVPRDSFGRTLDEPTIDDEALSRMPLSAPAPTSAP